jgi:hypothetical protein
VIAQDVWPGIDVEYRAQTEGVETLYHVKPGADVNQIVIEYEGLDAPLRTDSQGNLVLKTSLGEVKEKAPFAYQNDGHKQTQVPVRFKLLGNNKYTLACEFYDAGKELLIDPLIYSTYFGSADGIRDMTRDQNRNLIVTGSQSIGAFPTTPGAYQETPAGQGDAYVSKLTPDARQLIFSTFVGGNNRDASRCEVVDVQGTIYFGGYTLSADWPLTTDAFDSLFAGTTEGIFCRLSSTGSSLEYSSYIGGAGNDYVYDLARDNQTGEIYFCGEARQPNTDFPITADAMFSQSFGHTSFVSIFNPSTFVLAYSTFFPSSVSPGGPTADRVVPIGDRQVWLSGWVYTGGLLITADAFQPTYGGGYTDGFCAHLDFQSNQIVYCSYLGGHDREDVCRAQPLSGSRVLLCGTTASPDFPVTTNAFDTTLDGESNEGFVSILEIPGTLVSSTYLGGYDADAVYGVAQRPDGKIFAYGRTVSANFPVTPDGMDTTLNSSSEHEFDGFVSRLSADLSSLEYGTFVGGTNLDEIYCGFLDGEDTLWVGGHTQSSDFPVTPDAFQQSFPGINANFIAVISIGSGSGISARPTHIPLNMSLTSFPNPFNMTTTISFVLPAQQNAQLRVFDVLGREVSRESLGWLCAGSHQSVFDGAELASGLYFVRLESGQQMKTVKMMLMK